MCISETAMRKCYKVKQQSFQTRSSKCSFGLQLGTGRRRGWHLLGLGDAWLSIISCEERYRLDRCFMKISWLYKKWFPLEYENPSDGDFLCDCKKRNSCRITIGKSRLITILGDNFLSFDRKSLPGSILYFHLESFRGPQNDGVLKGTFLSFWEVRTLITFLKFLRLYNSLCDLKVAWQCFPERRISLDWATWYFQFFTVTLFTRRYTPSRDRLWQ